MAFRLHRNLPLTEDARGLAGGELRAAIDRLGDESGAVDPRVHSARKSIKRVRALLRLVRVALPPRRFREHNAALRDAARGLSAARDAAVAVAALAALVPEPDALLTAVRNDLVARRGDAHADPTTLTAPTTLADPTILGAAAEALRAARPRLLEDLDDLRWSTLEAGLEDSYGGGRTAMRAAFASPDDEAFHEWRKRAKDLWYQCQLLQGACPEQLGALETMLAELGDGLGEDHDLSVLQAAASPSPALHQRISLRHQELRSALWLTGQRVYAERPRAFIRRVRTYYRVWRGDDESVA